MIGIAHGEKEFRCFIVKEATLEEERRILISFKKYIEKMNFKRLLHWGSHEKTVFSTLCSRHDIQFHVEFVDMRPPIIKKEFCPYGAFSFGLKTITKALNDLGLINVKWESDCKDGQSAMYAAFKAYEDNELDVLKDIEEYNKIDVIATMEVWKYLSSIGITI